MTEVIMEAQLIEEQELLEYDCSDGNQVIIATSEEIITATSCDITGLPHGTEVLEVHQGEDGNFTLTTSGGSFTTGEIEIQSLPEAELPDATSSSKTECEECGVRFLSAKTLKLHNTVHVDEAYYACEFCSANRIHWTEMWLHQCSNAESAPIVCPQCHKKVSTKKQLQVHEEVHELQRRFTSKRMSGYFERKLKEREDPEIDWGAKPFICGVCGKPFSKLYEVEYHEKLHTGERPSTNQCDKCGLTYINKHDLNKHNALGCIGLLSRKTNSTSKRNHSDIVVQF